MTRLPLRVRLTLVFAAASAIVLGGTGFLLYHHLETSLDRALAQSLRARSADVTALIQQADTGLSQSRRSSEGFAQVLTPARRVFDQSPGLARTPLLDGTQVRRALHATVTVSQARRAGRSVRLLATPVHAQDQRLVVVVGELLTARDATLSSLRNELLVGGPLALLLVSSIGYLVAAGALRPVERIRTRASEVSEHDLSERLPVPRGGDELARLGRTLNEMLARIENGVRRERSFVADASHELRTPLALLRAEVDVALDHPRKSAELQAALRSVGEEVDRLSRLAEDLLLLARLDEGRLALRPERVEFDELLETIARRFGRRVREAGRRIETDGDDLTAELDRARIEQALGNLVDNALRHGAGTIRIAAARAVDALELSVSDEGNGFPPSFARHAFERFSRDDGARTRGGTGLGLAIVRAIAESHGGSAVVSGRAQVLLRLAVAVEPAVAKPAPACVGPTVGAA